MATAWRPLLTISLTINWCALCGDAVPRLHRWAVASPGCARIPPLRALCRSYNDTPAVLASTLTEQSLVWLLVTLAVVAVCVCDVIRYPFRSPAPDGGCLLLETIFGVNVGKYAYLTWQAVVAPGDSGRRVSRAALLHHAVTLASYTGILISGGQNALLGVAGLFMEATTVLDAADRHLKSRHKQGTVVYRRLTGLRCVAAPAVRGALPITFLVVSLAQQSPFLMDYVPLTIFFVDIIFFSVVNVWLILSSISRVAKLCHFHPRHVEAPTDLTHVSAPRHIPAGTQEHTAITMSHHAPGRQEIQFTKNDLGYLRSYDNKNIADMQDQPRLNNGKEYPKENMELNVHTLTTCRHQGYCEYVTGPVCGTAISASRDAISESRDAISVTRDGISVTRDGISVTRDSVSVTSDRILTSRDAISESRDGISVTMDGIPVTRDGVSVNRDGISTSRDAISVTRDGIYVTRDGVPVTRDGIYVTRDGVSGLVDSDAGSNVRQLGLRDSAESTESAGSDQPLFEHANIHVSSPVSYSNRQS